MFFYNHILDKGFTHIKLPKENRKEHNYYEQEDIM